MYFSYQKIIAEIEHSDEIFLHDSEILSYGNKRVCYYYNSNPSKLIKISRDQKKWQEGHKQSLTEWYVSKNIKSIGMNCRISLCHGWVKTNKGLGLVVDKISNDKDQSLTLRKLLFSRVITVNEAIKLVEETIQNFLPFGVPASDFNIDNFILTGKISEHKIIMVDGYSPKQPNFKTYLLLNNKFFANYYAKRKWRLIKPRFTVCAQEVYAGNYYYAMPSPLSDVFRAHADITSG